jgi:hypothetical protein
MVSLPPSSGKLRWEKEFGTEKERAIRRRGLQEMGMCTELILRLLQAVPSSVFYPYSPTALFPPVASHMSSAWGYATLGSDLREPSSRGGMSPLRRRLCAPWTLVLSMPKSRSSTETGNRQRKRKSQLSSKGPVSRSSGCTAALGLLCRIPSYTTRCVFLSPGMRSNAGMAAQTEGCRLRLRERPSP